MESILQNMTIVNIRETYFLVPLSKTSIAQVTSDGKRKCEYSWMSYKSDFSTYLVTN